MTRKHFTAVADRIRRNRRAFADDATALLALTCLAQDLAHEFAEANPRFDRQRFLTACGV